MAIINQSTIVLILIISYSLGLDLFRRSKINTQEASLICFGVFFATFWYVYSKALFDKLNYVFANHVFFEAKLKEIWLDGGQFLLWMGASFYYLKLPVNLAQHHGGQWGASTLKRAYFNRAVKHFLS